MPRKPVSNRTNNTANLNQQQQHDRNMGKNKQKGVNPVEDSTLEKTLKKFKSARDYTRRGFWDTWEQSWKLYNSERVSIGYDGNSDVFVPQTYTLIQKMKAHLVNGKLEIQFKPTHPDQNGDIQKLQDLFNYAWDKDYMNQKIDSTIDGYLVPGNAYIFSWVGEDGFPCQEYVDAKDAFFDPSAKNYQTLGYCGYRYLTTVEDLKQEQITNIDYDKEDPKSTPRVDKYKNLNKIEGGWTDYGKDKTAKQEREDMLAGNLMSDKTNVVEVIVYIDKERMIKIANRNVIIEDIETPYKREARTIDSVDDEGKPHNFELPEIKPFLPVAPFRDITDGNMWYAKGEVEIIAESQERLNDTQSQKSDNLSFALNRMWALDPNFSQKIDEIQSVPGAVFTVPPGALQAIENQPIGPEADNEIARIKSEMEAATAANELVQNSMESSGRKSAYEINQNLVSQGSRFMVKLRQLENEGMKILAQNMWKIMQIYIDKEIPIRVGDDENPEWDTYNPGLYLGDWDVKVMLGASVQAIKETERQQAMQFYLLASKLPFVNQQKLFEITSEQLFDKTKREVKSLIMPPPEEPPASIQPKLIETVKFGELYPDEQAELLAESGITPSPLREAETGVANPPAQETVNPIDPQTGKASVPSDYSQADMEPAEKTANIPGIPQANL